MRRGCADIGRPHAFDQDRRVSLTHIAFIVLSALLHATYNLLMRRAHGERAFLVRMFVVASVISLTCAAVVDGTSSIVWGNTPVVVATSAGYVSHQILVAKAYERGSISALYPLTMLSPMLVPVWGLAFLGERISAVTAGGIGATLCGAFLVKMRALSQQELIRVWNLRGQSAGAGYAVAASLVYSIGAALDKSRVASFPLMTYIAPLISTMTVLAIGYLYAVERRPLGLMRREDLLSALAGGAIVTLSFLSFRVALREVAVSLAVSVRQTSIVFAIALGAGLLHERLAAGKLVGSLVLILGVIVIGAGR